MDRKPSSAPRSASPIAGGALLALSLVVGTVIGVRNDQPSLGFLAGLGAGLALMLVIALIDRNRRG